MFLSLTPLFTKILALPKILSPPISPPYLFLPLFDTYVKGLYTYNVFVWNVLWTSSIIFKAASQLSQPTSNDLIWMVSLVARCTKPSWVERCRSFFMSVSTKASSLCNISTCGVRIDWILITLSLMFVFFACSTTN